MVATRAPLSLSSAGLQCRQTPATNSAARNAPPRRRLAASASASALSPAPWTPLRLPRTLPELLSAGQAALPVLANPQSASYAAYTALRSAFFTASTVAVAALTGSGSLGAERMDRQGARVDTSVGLSDGLLSVLESQAELYRRDLENVTAGLYRAPHDANPSHRQFSPAFIADKAARTLRASRETAARRAAPGGGTEMRSSVIDAAVGACVCSRSSAEALTLHPPRHSSRGRRCRLSVSELLPPKFPFSDGRLDVHPQRRLLRARHRGSLPGLPRCDAAPDAGAARPPPARLGRGCGRRGPAPAGGGIRHRPLPHLRQGQPARRANRLLRPLALLPRRSARKPGILCRVRCRRQPRARRRAHALRAGSGRGAPLPGRALRRAALRLPLPRAAGIGANRRRRRVRASAQAGRAAVLCGQRAGCVIAARAGSSARV